MELKPGYKQTEVGVIPEDWDVQTMATLAKITTGPFGTLLKASEYSADDAGVPLVSVGEVRDGYIKITERTPRVPPTVILRLPQYVLKTGDIVFGRKGAVDRSALITEIENGFFLGSDGISVRLSGSCSPVYASCQLRSHRVRSWLLQNAIGTTMASLNQGILKKIPLSLPPWPEQEAIASALGEIDDFIQGLDELISKKHGIKQAAMQELLTGKRRLPGFEGEWVVKRLGDLGEFLKGSGVKKDEAASGELPCVRYGEIYTHHENYISEFSSRISETVAASATAIRQGDILFAGSGETKEEIGKSVALALPVKAFAGGDIVILRQNAVDALFLGYRLNALDVARQKAGFGQGDAVVHISAHALSKISVSVPGRTEQEAIAGILYEMDAELRQLQERLSKTQSLKQGMMQQLLTGKIRLK